MFKDSRTAGRPLGYIEPDGLVMTREIGVV